GHPHLPHRKGAVHRPDQRRLPPHPEAFRPGKPQGAPTRANGTHPERGGPAGLPGLADQAQGGLCPGGLRPKALFGEAGGQGG
ncbi:hypothetical protein ABTP60_18775, partial [Acinetobacter baumannii]